MNTFPKNWPQNFPKIMRFVDLDNCSAKPWHILKQHPDYDAAKNHENRIAAARLIHSFLKQPENQKQMLYLKTKFPDAVITPVHAIEANGKNRIPEILAEYLSKKTGLEADVSIVQKDKIHRTGSDDFHRFAFRPRYDGHVRQGRRYILVDDVFTQGGSLNELRLFIEKQGGNVVQMAAMSLGGHGDIIAMKPETQKRLLDKFGENNVISFMKEIDLYDGNYKSLTEPEAYFLGRTASLNQARDRILAARQAGRTRDSQETIRQPQTSTITQSVTSPKPGRGFRR
ncbi:MAG: hypothetical protein Pg6A_01390 [Termitinemataceae bacterium]|jgi:adenine/guanine phosphoribosyltransferase-like PRPP-binding protein|nr:MAG: hypothetical protein Pg6A_01390 [Termitinemataceae bacterium]